MLEMRRVHVRDENGIRWDLDLYISRPDQLIQHLVHGQILNDRFKIRC